MRFFSGPGGTNQQFDFSSRDEAVKEEADFKSDNKYFKSKEVKNDRKYEQLGPTEGRTTTNVTNITN